MRILKKLRRPRREGVYSFKGKQYSFFCGADCLRVKGLFFEKIYIPQIGEHLYIGMLEPFYSKRIYYETFYLSVSFERDTATLYIQVVSLSEGDDCNTAILLTLTQAPCNEPVAILTWVAIPAENMQQ